MAAWHTPRLLLLLSLTNRANVRIAAGGNNKMRPLLQSFRLPQLASWQLLTHAAPEAAVYGGGGASRKQQQAAPAPAPRAARDASE